MCLTNRLIQAQVILVFIQKNPKYSTVITLPKLENSVNKNCLCLIHLKDFYFYPSVSSHLSDMWLIFKFRKIYLSCWNTAVKMTWRKSQSIFLGNNFRKCIILIPLYEKHIITNPACLLEQQKGLLLRSKNLLYNPFNTWTCMIFLISGRWADI